MSELYWLSEAQMERLRPYFPKNHGVPRVDDRRVLSGIILINRNGLRWRGAPREYGPYKTLYADHIEVHLPPSCRVPVTGLLGELDAVVSQNGVETISRR